MIAVAAVLALALASIGANYLLSDDDSVNAEPDTTASTPDVTAKPATLEATRNVSVHGAVVTVRETTHVVSGGPIVVTPSSRKLALGLSPQKTAVAGEDGSIQPFKGPTPVATGRSITIVGTYRLTDCPDLLPSHWPSPVAVVPGRWSRTYIRNEAPVRTAQAICKSAKSSTKNLSDLRGVMTKARKPTLRLTWRDSKPLTVLAIGSASGVAAIGSGPGCADDCVATTKPRSTFRMSLRPLERCAIGRRSNQLTLRVSVGNDGPKTVGINVSQLGQTMCKASAR